jgi:dephospho-CoA kinase
MKNKKVILAVVGLAGAGKTEAINYFLEKTKLPKVYFGDATFEEIKKQGLEINEANERKVREELRAKHGMAAYAIVNLPKVKELFKESSVLIESLYSWEEYEIFKNEFGDDFYVLAIYTSPETRIARLKNRPIRPLTREELLSRDKAQIENLHQAGPIAKADWTIVNEGDRVEFYSNLDRIITDVLQ